MKKITSFITTLCLLAFFGISGFSQNHPNNLEVMDLHITQAGKITSVKMHSSKTDLLKAFGKPLVIEPYYFEMDNKHGVVVKYQGANFYYADNKLTGFDLDVPAKAFLLSFTDQATFLGVDRPLHMVRNLKYINGGAFFNMQNYGIDANEILSFETGQNQLVTKIIYTSYNSKQEVEVPLDE